MRGDQQRWSCMLSQRCVPACTFASETAGTLSIRVGRKERNVGATMFRTGIARETFPKSWKVVDVRMIRMQVGNP